MRIVYLCLLLYLGLGASLLAQRPSFPENGVVDQREGCYLFTNAHIQTGPKQLLKNAQLLIKEGKIVAVGQDLKVPKGAVEIDLAGKYIYPSFIELSTNYGLSANPKKDNNQGNPQFLSDKKGAFSWNEAIRPEQRADQLFSPDKKAAKALRQAGFGLCLSQQKDGIARGSSALVFLGEESAQEMILKGEAAAHYSFSKGSSSQDYPSSLMGAIALLRQSYYDADYYQKQEAGLEYNRSLARFNELQALPQFFEAKQRFNILRAHKIAQEFGKEYIFVGAGDEYRRLEALQAIKAKLVVPLNFPEAYDVSDPLDANFIKLGQMLHWELAPANPAALAEAGLAFALTTEGLKKPTAIWASLRKAYAAGLSEEDLLAALTTQPASFLGLSEQVGTLEAGKWANFFISSAPILMENSQLLQHWVKGKVYSEANLQADDIRGTYSLNLAQKSYQISIEGKAFKPTAKLTFADSSQKPIKLKLDYHYPSLSLSGKFRADSTAPIIRISAQWKEGSIIGYAEDEKGNWLNVKGQRQAAFKPKKAAELPKRDSSLNWASKLRYPFTAFGHTAEQAPKQEVVLFKGATVWTNEKQGILENTDVLIENGKIKKIGKNIKLPKGAKLVDAQGKHLTTGIIDEHSHIAIQNGVNEGTQASSAEVRIGDVLNSDDVNIYRQLAGGVTTAQLLHGSANPIGGQAALIKFRWGLLPEELKYENAAPFIKFALGENVKQSNWGDRQNKRFPQTRMGVEQVYEDYFSRAQAYGEALKKEPENTRRDIELDALLEILNKERFISCHSYVQSEITMLMRVAERYNFRINTFTHILEGYKVADKMKEHGAGGSTFSDWWAYKAEVRDAIPYNAKILDAMDVVTAINSDDAEMGRRLNQEAAKGVKYGQMSEEEAWKMVTLNPAKLLRCDDQLGSIKKGKSADLVLWSDNPLSIYAKAEQTYVDGICYYSLERDQRLRAELKAERQRLIQKMLGAKSAGEPTQPAMPTEDKHYHCGDVQLNALGGWKVD